MDVGDFGCCDSPGCQNRFDFRQWDKPPPGWGHVTIQRWGKKGSKTETRLVCPEHSMDFAPRTGLLPQRSQWKRVLIESPFGSDDDTVILRNLKYLRAIMRACLLNGEAPFASHALYTQPGVLNDRNSEERRMGIEAGLEWGEAADKTVVYTDLGISDGMRKGVARAEEQKRPVERRRLKNWEG